MPTRPRRNSLTLLLLLLAVAGVSACSGKVPGVYRIPIQQGNVITVEMLQELKLGMDKRKVRFILGTPMVADAFHQERWDYYYSYEPGSGDRVQQLASLFFDEDVLVRINADIDSAIDFHTVTHATENVLIVPPKKKGGFFAALTPAFIEREEEKAKEEEIARSLDDGFNESQPGSGESATSGAALDPALAAPIGAGLAIDEAATPSEVYAPNTSASVDPGALRAPKPPVPVEVVSAETRSRSSYLEQLFEGYGDATPAPAARAEEPEAAAAPLPAPLHDATVPTRD